MSAFGSKGARQAQMPKISERASAASRDYQGVKQVDLFSGVGASSGLNQKSDTELHSSAPVQPGQPRLDQGAPRRIEELQAEHISIQNERNPHNQSFNQSNRSGKVKLSELFKETRSEANHEQPEMDSSENDEIVDSNQMKVDFERRLEKKKPSLLEELDSISSSRQSLRRQQAAAESEEQDYPGFGEPESSSARQWQREEAA